MYSVIQSPTNIFGLKYRPSIAPMYSDDADSIAEFHKPLPRHLSTLNELVIIECATGAKSILEIGVHAHWTDDDPSSTQLIIKYRHAEAIYIGIDIVFKDLSYMGDDIYCLQANSGEIEKVEDLMKLLSIKTFDFIFIDGWHSVNQVLLDWRYAKYLDPKGVIAMHDTNSHPGPVTLFDAVDETLFDKIKYVGTGPDYGISTFRFKSV